ADRAWTDHWRGDDPRTRYYEVVGVGLLADARRLDPFGRPDPPGASAVRRRLDAADGLVVQSPPALRMIPGDRLVVTAGLGLAPGAKPAAGFPVLWADPGEGLTFGRPQDAGRAVVPAGKTTEAERLTVTLTSPELMRAEESPPAEATARRSEVAWQGYYRGQK